MDGVEPELVESARKAAEGIPGIQAASVRGRWMGRSLIIEVEGSISPETSIADAQRLAPKVEMAIRHSVGQVRKVIWIPRPGEA